MSKSFRTYRSLARFIAAVTFLGSVLPFIGHVCLMAEAHPAPVMNRCCCDGPHHDHDGIRPADAPCEEVEVPHESHHGTTHSGECCQIDSEAGTFDATTRTGKASPEELVISAHLLQAHRISRQAPQKKASRLQDTGPPPVPSQALHLLYSCFLI